MSDEDAYEQADARCRRVHARPFGTVHEVDGMQPGMTEAELKRWAPATPPTTDAEEATEA